MNNEWIERISCGFKQNTKKQKIPCYRYIIKPKTNRKVTKEDEKRIRKLCIPPNWKNVKVALSKTESTQVTAKDEKGRTQYLYHPMWNMLAKQSKYERMKKFSTKIDKFITHIQKELTKPKSPNYTMVIMFMLLYKTHLRVGCEQYVIKNKTYGLTTLLGKHVKLEGNTIRLSFIGKKNVPQKVKCTDKYIAKYIKKLNPKPSQSLFPQITSVMMNVYLQERIGSEFTCKDFRTYASNLLFLTYLAKQPLPSTQTETKKSLTKTYEKVAEHLGHSCAISKKSYITPYIHEQYEKNPKLFYGKNPGYLFKKFV